MIIRIAFLIFTFTTGNLFAQAPPETPISPEQESRQGPPKPPMGKRWVLNPDFSDEFNGTELDTTKWYDHHPTYGLDVHRDFLWYHRFPWVMAF
ncbi:hypothetical protein [Zobellia laminariae]|uniref:hypothetical protein n=1 Tax=Zobellia laminariae TaxID=248906 RepID=UPI0026F41629|nr:hypothetical protein [Zobellia laminariae]WKX76605.1 hypothetical protein Q5W13_24415 [Zobellia laminariae]